MLVSDILLFFVSNQKRVENDKNNKIREDILEILHTPPIEFTCHEIYGETWKTMADKWGSTISKLCDSDYDDISVKKKAGRLHNYDFDVSFLKEGQPVKVVKVEFKYNSDSLDKIPQYFNASENKRFISTCYAEYFYDNYIDKICGLDDSLLKPPKDVYMNHIYSSDYSSAPFFEKLYEKDVRGTSFYKMKQSIVRESIKTYLELYGNGIDLQLLTSEIKRSQNNKVFILWNKEDFKIDTMRDEESELESIVEIKNNNVIVVKSKSGATHNLLLRWKNHLGILFPAWQIKLER